MRWGRWIVIGVLVLGLLSPAGALAATEASKPSAAAFRLQATHGYSILVLAIANPSTGAGAVVLFVAKRGDAVSYEAPATVTAEAIEADLGGLGRIELRPQPLGTEETTRSECSAKPVKYEATALVGEVLFEGEEGYTTASATRVKDLVKPFLDLVCAGSGESVTSGPGLPGAQLSAYHGGRSPVRLRVDTNGPDARVGIAASITEKVGQISIKRSVGRQVGSTAFDYDSRLRSATVAPPSPFSGRGFFLRAAARGHRWSGDLAVDFPGRSHVPVAGAGFGAALVPIQRSVRRSPPARRPLSLLSWPSTNPWPTASATSSPAGPS